MKGTGFRKPRVEICFSVIRTSFLVDGGKWVYPRHYSSNIDVCRRIAEMWGSLRKSSGCIYAIIITELFKIY